LTDVRLDHSLKKKMGKWKPTAGEGEMLAEVDPEGRRTLKKSFPSPEGKFLLHYDDSFPQRGEFM